MPWHSHHLATCVLPFYLACMSGVSNSGIIDCLLLMQNSCPGFCLCSISWTKLTHTFRACTSGVSKSDMSECQLLMQNSYLVSCLCSISWTRGTHTYLACTSSGSKSDMSKSQLLMQNSYLVVCLCSIKRILTCFGAVIIWRQACFFFI